MEVDRVQLRPFTRADQPAARALILAGLGERWGSIDEGLNPDLTDIAHTFAPGCFLVGHLVGHADDALVATGAWLPTARDTVQVQRMSIAAALRRRGLGARMLAALLDAARVRGYTRAILETTATWHDAVDFYRARGFRPFDLRDGDIYLERALI